MVDRLASIKKQIAALEKKANDLLKAQNQKNIERVRSLIHKHGLTAEDLGFAAAPQAKSKARRTKAAPQAGVPRYRDPASGKTWTGRGKPPSWIASVKDRAEYLIGDDTIASGPKRKKPGASASSTKGTTKGGRSRAAPTSKTEARKGRGAKSAPPKSSAPAKKSKPIKTAPPKRRATLKRPKTSAVPVEPSSSDSGAV